MFLSFGKNEYGTPVSVHRCEACGEVFRVCPAAKPGQAGWENCLGPDCSSYDPTRDADKFFDREVVPIHGISRR